jgi:uncharacterized Fe-S radical SAM superfamily protein PflX
MTQVTVNFDCNIGNFGDFNGKTEYKDEQYNLGLYSEADFSRAFLYGMCIFRCVSSKRWEISYVSFVMSVHPPKRDGSQNY